jgi:hypothetical protein
VCAFVTFPTECMTYSVVSHEEMNNVLSCPGKENKMKAINTRFSFVSSKFMAVLCSVFV